MKPRLGISACLLGRTVRWDGGHKRDVYLTEMLAPWVDWVPVCPEVELGLGVPREPIHLVRDGATSRLVATRTGRDLTARMRRLARSRIAQLARENLSGFVVKKDSPSCGMERVRVHRAAGPTRRDGRGMFTRVLMERMPLLPVEEEGRLHDGRLRENFIERVFAYDRWRRFARSRPTVRRLVELHTAHEFQLLAHDPAGHARLGRLVARAKERPLPAVVAEYGTGIMGALARIATPGRHANVLERLLGFFSGRLGPAERAEVVGVIADYRQRIVPLVVPLTLVKHHVRRLDIDYLARQTYLDPHPNELMLRNHV